MKKKNTNAIIIEVSIGELIDRITILEIKAIKFTSKDKIENAQIELKLLLTKFKQEVQQDEDILKLMCELKEINLKLWDLENHIRVLEEQHKFDSNFIETARCIYKTNDRRTEIKKMICRKTNSRIVDEKEYFRFPE